MNINKKSALVSSFCGLMKSTVLINVHPQRRRERTEKTKERSRGAAMGNEDDNEDQSVKKWIMNKTSFSFTLFFFSSSPIRCVTAPPVQF